MAGVLEKKVVSTIVSWKKRNAVLTDKALYFTHVPNAEIGDFLFMLTFYNNSQ